MKLSFQLHPERSDAISAPLDVSVTHCIIAGWSGRDQAAIEHHIEELAAIGVSRPSAVPLFYRVAANQLIQGSQIQVVGNNSSGEAEAFIFSHQGALMVSLASDHTDRKLEGYSVALSKQICVKPVAHDAWSYASVADHWDALVLRSWIDENGRQVAYQEGTMAQLRTPLELIEKCFGTAQLPAGHAMTCGTVTVQGGIRPSRRFTMELQDPVRARSIRHSYTVNDLPEIA